MRSVALVRLVSRGFNLISVEKYSSRPDQPYVHGTLPTPRLKMRPQQGVTSLFIGFSPHPIQTYGKFVLQHTTFLIGLPYVKNVTVHSEKSSTDSSDNLIRLVEKASL